jgi:hypothetical protein
VGRVCTTISALHMECHKRELKLDGNFLSHLPESCSRLIAAHAIVCLEILIRVNNIALSNDDVCLVNIACVALESGLVLSSRLEHSSLLLADDHRAFISGVQLILPLALAEQLHSLKNHFENVDANTLEKESPSGRMRKISVNISDANFCVGTI